MTDAETPENGPRDHADTLRVALETVIGTPFMDGNRVDTLVNGDEIFPAMLKAIRAAKERVEFLTFVYWTGDIAEAFVDAFIDRRRAGVEVFVMLDGFGGRLIDDTLLDKMEAEGVELRWFRPLHRFKVWEADNRTHRKLLIVDGQVGFTGGVGIAEEWTGDARDETEWRDNHYRVEGPALIALRAAFFENWIDSAQTIAPLTGEIHEPEPKSEGLKVQTCISTAGTGWSAVARLHEALILLAETRIRIATPYFAPRPSETRRMIEALERGVRIQIIVPGPHIDKRVSQLGSAEDLEDLLEAGAELHRFQPAMFHHKLVSVDGVLASIGSANFNMRSAFKDDELALNVMDAGFCAKADAIFERDLERCERVRLGDWEARGLWRRVKERGSRLVRNQA